MARPSKLTSELINNMADKIREGLPINYTCDLFGVLSRSYFQWMKLGEEDINNEQETLYALFFHTIKKAQAEYVDNAGRDIRSGRPGWQGASWWLERTRQDFMPKQEITAGDDGKVTVVLGGKIKDVKKHE